MRSEIHGQRGRIAKDRYLRTGDPALLRSAIDSYCHRIADGGDALWLGLNAHVLAHLGRRRGIDVPPLTIDSEAHLLPSAATNADGDDHWAVATWIEAHLLVGLPLPVDAIVHRLSTAPPYVHASMRRQLTQTDGTVLGGLPVFEVDRHPTRPGFVVRFDGAGGSAYLPDADPWAACEAALPIAADEVEALLGRPSACTTIPELTR